MTDDRAQFNGLTAWVDQPGADPDSCQCAVINFKQPVLGARRFQFSLGQLQRLGGGFPVSRLPEIIKIGGLRRGRDAQQFRERGLSG